MILLYRDYNILKIESGEKMQGIRERRLELGKRQIDVARECNVGMTTVYLWDKGNFKSMREENRALLKKCLKLNDNELPPVWKYSRKGE